MPILAGEKAQALIIPQPWMVVFSFRFFCDKWNTTNRSTAKDEFSFLFWTTGLSSLHDPGLKKKKTSKTPGEVWSR